MPDSNYDVLIVGAGAAGLTAAIGLARAGFGVAAVEAAAFPGAENWSGCVYFCENLAHPDILGTDGVEALAWERRLVERGFFATDGHSLLGLTYRDPAAFRHCYTVLRPIYDHHLAQVALRHGVTVLSETTAESLIRDGGRVIGVCTNRGALYADLVFLAEGDASHLVTREGYERSADPREAPKFLQGIKQVIELSPGAVERTFSVGPEEGVAYEILVRNGTLRGKPVQLNMGGFVYTNRQSLSIGLVLPADNLTENFDGDPNLLMQWFEKLPALEPWLRDGRRGTFGAKVIRGGGARDIPRLIDHGLAIGGAASGIGVDFPYPNFTGPATAMGLLLAQAAARIRREGGGFTQDALRRHYLEPLQQTHYWRDVEFLRRWPAYVKRTQVFFGRNIDLALGSAYVWTRPKRWFFTKLTNWLRLLRHVAGPGRWQELRNDAQHLVRALRLREVMDRPGIGRITLDGTVNALRDLFGQPRPHLPAAGTVQLHYRVAGEDSVSPPRSFHRWFRRFAPVLAPMAQKVYSNDSRPLPEKLNGAIRLLLRQINMLDVVAASALGLLAALLGFLLVGWDKFLGLFRWGPKKQPRGLYPRYAQAARQATDLTSAVASATQDWEGRLAQLGYDTVKTSHIHLHWPRSLPEKNAVVQEGLWHVCPAHVYEARVSPLGQLQVVVNFENCIKCETCWRTSDLVDWGRDGQHRFTYPVYSPSVHRLLEAIHSPVPVRPALPRSSDAWARTADDLIRQLQGELPTAPLNGQDAEELTELHALADRLDRKLAEFDTALAEEPRTIDRSRAEYLEMLARYPQQLAVRIVEVLRTSRLAESRHHSVVAAHRQLLDLANALANKAEERARRTWDQRFAWAAADGRQLRYHHLTGLRRLLEALGKHVAGPAPAPDPALRWLRATDAGLQANIQRQLDSVFPAGFWRELERQQPLTSEQDAVLRDLLAQVPAIDPAKLTATLHPPLRKALLAELGRRDPSLAYRAASHLWARDLAVLATRAAWLADAAARWARGDEWACFAVVDAIQTSSEGWKGEALFVPAQGARSLALLVGDRLVLLPRETAGRRALKVEPLATLGLRGAGLASIRLEGLALPAQQSAVDRERLLRAWNVLSAADLTSIAFGMADQLCQRAVAHATSRVQFPGLFQDEETRDTLGKFGAVKKMVAEMAARRYLIETLDQVLSPADFSSPSVEQAGLVKAVVAEALGSAPGSISYNAGQVFGGTGYSEDDILSKFYRDAAAWRFVGPANSEVFRRHGEEVFRAWRADGQRLTAVPDEIELFEQLAQRKALQAELDEVRVARSRLRGIVNDWHAAHRSIPAELLEGLARQNALLLASKALLLRTHARLEHGLPAETEAALVRVWLEEAAVSLEEFETTARQRLDGGMRREERPVVEPGAGPLVHTYDDYLSASAPYDSGDFLRKPMSLVEPRFVPEMIDVDPALSARNRQIRELLIGHFGQPRPSIPRAAEERGRGESGLPFERYIEYMHRPDPEDLDFCRRHGFFRVPIPRELGGEGRRKVDYYLLTTNAQRLADVAISLTIQANTSIGTTPIFLARDKDLPKAQKELAAFISDPAIQKEIRQRLEALLKQFKHPDPRRIESRYRELHKRLEETVLARSALRVLLYRFIEAWQTAGRAGLVFNLPGMRVELESALQHWNETFSRAEEFHGELVRRREACDLFLRWIASGQISAFALTEPSAGSDTARVATRAVLRSVPIEKEEDGVLRFVPFGGKAPRRLLDAKRIEFRPEGACYRWSDAAEPSPIHFDEYDYETDDPRRLRYYDHGGRRVHFTDIAQLRERDGRLWYDYWELTGAKMWITNARMAGVMCLYAKTAEGVTGFLVDRHTEGLIVGKDEAKMGQCGSPTNELSLQAVRVPRENVLGLEGRGQVNALETLNVGRAGLAMSAMAQMEGLLEGSRAFARARHGEVPDWAAWRLERMEEDRFTAEALAHEVVGRFDHPETMSVRMESAISKMLVSELLHRVIELAEEIHGLSGQTQRYLVEKRKRDARILNIYEGTNEVQRFLILKDLTALSRETAGPPDRLQHAGHEALELETLKGAVRQRLASAVETFGQQVWENPNLQPSCFLLAEAAAWLKAADSSLGRLAWLTRQEEIASDEPADQSDADAGNGGESSSLSTIHYPLSTPIGHRAFARCCAEVRERLRRFDEESAHLRRGYYAPAIRAASLLFRQTPLEKPSLPSSRIARPLSVLVVLEPTAAGVPHPHVNDGRLCEPHWTLSDGDRSALEAAFRLRDAAAARVTIQTVAVGPRGAAAALREALSLGVDRARLIVSEAEAVTSDCAAAALANLLRAESGIDLILAGGARAGDEDGLVGRILAEKLEILYAGRAAQLVVVATKEDAEVQLIGGDGRSRSRTLPAAATLEPGLPLRQFAVEGFLQGLNRAVEYERWPKRLPARRVAYAEGGEAAPSETSKQAAGGPLSPDGAAAQLLAEIGVRGGATCPEKPSAEPLQDVMTPMLLTGRVLAVLAADGEGRLAPSAHATIRAAQMLANRSTRPLGENGSDLSLLVLVPSVEEAQRRALAELREHFGGDVTLLAAATAPVSAEVCGRLLRECWPFRDRLPGAIIGEPWTEDAFAALACQSTRSILNLRVRRMSSAAASEVLLETARARGKLRLRQTLSLTSDATCWIALAADSDVALITHHSSLITPLGRVERWSPRLERFYARGEIQQLLDELKEDTGLVRLADADFIIDVGFGVGNRDGYEAVIEPLEKALRDLGVRHVVLAGSRKVTEELHLLPADRQIGQSGVSVNPKVLLAVGVSGAPQHLNYIGARAAVIAFNRDPEAPLLTLNRRQPRPRVYPVVGDLFETVPAFIAALGQEQIDQTPSTAEISAGAAAHP